MIFILDIEKYLIHTGLISFCTQNIPTILKQRYNIPRYIAGTLQESCCNVLCCI